MCAHSGRGNAAVCRSRSRTLGGFRRAHTRARRECRRRRMRRADAHCIGPQRAVQLPIVPRVKRLCSVLHAAVFMLHCCVSSAAASDCAAHHGDHAGHQHLRVDRQRLLLRDTRRLRVPRTLSHSGSVMRTNTRTLAHAHSLTVAGVSARVPHGVCAVLLDSGAQRR